MDAGLIAARAGLRDRLEAALLAAMDRAGGNVMRWGVDDCGCWCASVLREALGYDAAARFRYDSRDAARTGLGPLGLGFALKDVAKLHGWRRIAPDAARTGDIGLAILNGFPTTMICRAPGWFLARSERGFVALTDRVVRIAWAVV